MMLWPMLSSTRCGTTWSSGTFAQAKTVGLTRGSDEALDFHLALPLPVKLFGISAGVEFDELGSEAGRSLDLRRVRGDEEAHLNAGIVQAAARFCERGFLAGGVQPALGGDFLPPFRDEADHLRTKAEGELDDLRRTGHFQVQAGADEAAQLQHVALLNVPAILAQVGGDAVGAGRLAKQGGLGRTWLSLCPTPVTRFAQRGDVVDVDAQLEGHGGQGLRAGGRLVAAAGAFVPEAMRITLGGS